MRARVGDLFAGRTVELHRKGRSPSTIKGYERVYRHDIQPTLGTMPVTKVVTNTLTDGAERSRRPGMARATS